MNEKTAIMKRLSFPLTKVARKLNGKRTVFKKWCMGNCIATCKIMKLDPYLTPYPKINSKWITHLIVTSKNYKILRTCKSILS